MGIAYFLYDGDRLVAEYAANGLIAAGGTPTAPPRRRYAHGVGIDEPLLWFDVARTPATKWFYANRQGSIPIAERGAVSGSNGQLATSGSTVMAYTYGPYGEPQDWKGSRLRYTGQVAWAENELCPQCAHLLTTAAAY